jgi:hypothetical protein
MREPVGIEIEFVVLAGGVPFVPMLGVYTDSGLHAFNALDADTRWRDPLSPGAYVVTAWVPANLLNEGRYVVSVFLNEIQSGTLARHAVATEAVAVSVVNRDAGPSAKGDLAQQWGGAVSPLLNWTVVPVDERAADRARA